MASLGKKGQNLDGKYRIEFDQGYTSVAEMVECRGFSLHRDTAPRKKHPLTLKDKQHAR